MQNNFNICLGLVLAHEKGFVNDKNDPGGMTNLGVTQQVWEEWVGHPVAEKEMRNLTPLMVAPLYKRKYWDACRADELISGLDYCVFDLAVNSGVGRAIKLLQSCVGVLPDGGFGPTTYAAVVQFKGNSAKALIEDYCAKRLEFLQSLRTWPVFGKGWENRVNDVKQDALKMLG